MKKKYENPELKVTKFDCGDVISESNDLEIDFKVVESDQGIANSAINPLD